ncbi:methyl-accepting chemotaxis protein, partial [Campylobacter lari]|nr:methyl-accepting chemotaxis protein [Campylobacter lari]
MKSIKLKVSLIANTIAIFCLIILGVITFIFVKQALFDEIVKSEQNRLVSTKSLMEEFRENTTTTLKKLSETILRHPYSELNTQESLIQNVSSQLRAFRDAGGFLTVYLAQPDGEVILTNAESDKLNQDIIIFGKKQNFDARTREWYQEAKAKGIFVTPAYIDTTTNLPCFTYAMSLSKDGKFIGVLAIDVLVKDLEDGLKQMPGASFVFDKNNFAFASTSKNYIANDPNVSIVAEAFSKTKDGEPFYYTSKEGSERLAMCDRVNGYTICNMTYIDTIDQSSEKIAYIQAIIVIFTSIISVILLYFLVSH